MNLDERLDRVRAEVAEQVASEVRVPSFEGILARRARRRRLRATAGGAALVVVVAGAVGGIAATRPGASRSVPPAATLSVSRPPTAVTSPPASASPTTSPTTAPTSAQTYPAKGSSYVIVPAGDQLAWTDLKTGAHGHFGPADGSQLNSPSVSSDGRRVAYQRFTDASAKGTSSIAYWDLDTRSGGVLATSPTPTGVSGPDISPDGTRIAFAQPGSGIHIATIGAAGSTVKVPTPGASGGAEVQGVAWTGNDALAYVPPDEAVYGPPGADKGVTCAVEEITLVRSTSRCLLPTATLQAIAAPIGVPWKVIGVSGTGDTNLLALNIQAQPTVTAQEAGAPVSQAIAILDPAAEATPFHVLNNTAVLNSGPGELDSPVLLDRGTRVAYVDTTSPVATTPRVDRILVAPVAGGPTTTIASSPHSDSNNGLGATSG